MRDMNVAPVLLAGLLTLSAAIPFGAQAAEPPPPPLPLTKPDAKRILEAMEWRDVTIIAIVEGVNEAKITAPTLCYVLALAKRDGNFQDLKLNVFYDRDLGWFTYESSPKLFRIWTRDGYREVKAGIGF